MTRDWMEAFETFEDTGEAWGLDLRLSLADIIIKHLRQKGWTQRQLADRLGVREPVVSRLVHAQTNCTFDTVGKVLHALGVKADLVEPERIRGDSAFTTSWTPPVDTKSQSELHLHGQEEDTEENVTEVYTDPIGIQESGSRWKTSFTPSESRYTDSVG